MKEYKFKINGKDYEVCINGIEGGNADVTVNGINYTVEMENAPAAPQAPAPAAAPVAAPASTPAPAPIPAPASAGTGAKVIASPLPGVIIEISVKEGEAVKCGQKIAVLEAMKMENEIQAPADGVIKTIHVSKGDSVLEGDKVATIG